MNNNKDKKNKKLVEILENVMPRRSERDSAVAIDVDSNLDQKFIELIDKEAEEKRGYVVDDTDAISLDEEFDNSRELSKKELKKLAKQMKKEEEQQAKELRDDFLSTQENEILGDTDILEEIPNSKEVLKENKKKSKRKKK